MRFVKLVLRVNCCNTFSLELFVGVLLPCETGLSFSFPTDDVYNVSVQGADPETAQARPVSEHVRAQKQKMFSSASLVTGENSPSLKH